MAAISGLDPMPMTFAELRRAFQAKVDFEWGKVACQMAHNANLTRLLVSCHRRVGSRTYSPEDFYTPIGQTKRRKRSADIGSLRAMFTKPA